MGLNEEEPFYDYDTQLRLGGDFKDLLAGDFVDDRGIVVPKRELEYINHGVNSSVWKWKRESITRAVKSFLMVVIEWHFVQKQLVQFAI